MDKAVVRAFDLLKTVALADAPLRLTRISELTGLSKSTAHRQLQTLVGLGYVRQEPETGRYAPTLSLWELGTAVVSDHPVKRAATPFMHSLFRETGHTVSLLAPVGDHVIYLDKIISPRSAHFKTRPGSRVWSALTSGGRAMLAYDPRAEERLRRTAEALNGHRPFDGEAILHDLPAIRLRGYAVNRQNPEVVSLGCALLARDGTAAAALSVSTSVDRVERKDEDRIAEALVATCSRLAEFVGRL